MAWRPYGQLFDGELILGTRAQGILRFATFKGPEEFKFDLQNKGEHGVLRLKGHGRPRGEDGTEFPSQGGPERSRHRRGSEILRVGSRASHQAALRSMKDLDDGTANPETFRGHKDYMQSFGRKQEGNYFHAHQPTQGHWYIEWYSQANGRVVLELDNSQVDFVPFGG